MGGVVPDDLQRLGRFVGEDPQRRVGLERTAEVHVFSIHLGEDRGSRQPRADLLLHELGDRGAFRHLLFASVRKGNGDLLYHRSVGPSGFEPLTPTVSR